MNFRCCGYHHYGEYLDYIKLLVAAVTQTAPRPFCSAPAAAGRRRMQHIKNADRFFGNLLYVLTTVDQRWFLKNRLQKTYRLNLCVFDSILHCVQPFSSYLDHTDIRYILPSSYYAHLHRTAFRNQHSIMSFYLHNDT